MLCIVEYGTCSHDMAENDGSSDDIYHEPIILKRKLLFSLKYFIMNKSLNNDGSIDGKYHELKNS